MREIRESGRKGRRISDGRGGGKGGIREGARCRGGKGQGVAATLAANVVAATAAETAVGLLRRSSLSSHLRGRSVLLSSNDG